MKIDFLNKIGWTIAAILGASWTYVTFLDSARREIERSAVEKAIEACFNIVRLSGEYVASEDVNERKLIRKKLLASRYGEIALLGNAKIIESLQELVREREESYKVPVLGTETEEMIVTSDNGAWFANNLASDCGEYVNSTITKGWQFYIPTGRKTDLFQSDKSQYSKKDQTRFPNLE